MKKEKLSNKEYLSKNKSNQNLILTAAEMLESFGIPVDDFTPRRLEKMTLVFLAVAGIRSEKDFPKVKSIDDGVSLKTREIISYINDNFQEDISPGSYDDIRCKDLRFMVIGQIVLQTSPNSARNDSTRGYALSPEFAKAVGVYGTEKWETELKSVLSKVGDLKEKLEQERKLSLIPVVLPTGQKLTFSPGGHNDLQKAIIEEFLPRYGYGAEVLYVGDTSDKLLFLNEEALKKINFFELNHGELPDVVAYSPEKNWLYLIEAVYSSGPISPVRMAELEELATKCSAELIYVTAFLDKATFRRFVADIAWESEAWVADAPDHLVHFNGDKFMGPYKPQL